MLATYHLRYIKMSGNYYFINVILPGNEDMINPIIQTADTEIKATRGFKVVCLLNGAAIRRYLSALMRNSNKTVTYE